MSGDVFDASKDDFGLPPSSEKDSYTSMDMIDASMFGGNARFEFGGPAAGTIQEPNPSWGSKVTEKTPVYLTFSGGGHNLEFAASISENIDSWGYKWSFEVDMSSSTDTSESHGISIHGWSDASSEAKSKSAEVEHAMAWAKYGNLETLYVLGDPDPFDKFVIQVSTDKRFGTPLFRTIGGASKCPGEPDTMWRENGIQIRTEWAPGMNNEFIPPDSTALFDVIITNESPYRETLNYALALTSGTSYRGSFAGNMMDLGFKINGNPGLRPLGDAFLYINFDPKTLREICKTRVSVLKFPRANSSTRIRVLASKSFRRASGIFLWTGFIATRFPTRHFSVILSGNENVLESLGTKRRTPSLQLLSRAKKSTFHELHAHEPRPDELVDARSLDRIWSCKNEKWQRSGPID